jgi:hypothetical protein
MKRFLSAASVAVVVVWLLSPVSGAAQAPSLAWVSQGVAAEGQPAVRAVFSATRPASARPDLTSATTVVVGTASSFTITATFDASITSNPNAAALENAITTAIADYPANFSDNINVAITFKTMTSGLGQSSTLYFPSFSYSSFLSGLKASSSTADDATAYSRLPNSSTNPVNGSSSLGVKTANVRAVGLNGSTGGQPDGTISINTSLTTPGGPGTTGQYDMISVVQHEIDEVLGMGSVLPSSGAPFPTDLFRYNSSGARSFALSPSATAFLSIDTTTRIVQFNNVDNDADSGDWATTSSAQVQDAFGTPGSHPRLANSEMVNLDVIGYHRVSPNSFTDTPLTVGVTPIKAVHVTELRTRIQAQRTRFGLGTFNYTTSTLTAGATTIKVSDIAELRQALAEAYTAAGVAIPTYTDPALTAGATTIKAVHITELRSAVIALEAR